MALRLRRDRRQDCRHVCCALPHRFRLCRPRRRPGPRDLQRDLSGAILQSILGALLTDGYATAFVAAIAKASSAGKRPITNSVLHQFLKSFAGAVDTAGRYPRYASQITAAAKSLLLSGDHAAYAARLVAILLGAVVVFFLFPNQSDEQRLLAEYHSQDALAVHPHC